MTDIGAVEAALSYAARGWEVFPLLPGMKIPKKDFRWAARASKSEADIVRMFSGHMNIGIATGMRSRLLVCDVDLYKDDGAESFKHLIEERGMDWTFTSCVATPRGGLHYYFELDEPSSSQNDFLPGIDIKADGGYVVAPPSTISGQGAYTWKEEWS